jgi:hypothetical protein
VWPQINHLNSLGLSYHIFKMESANIVSKVLWANLNEIMYMFRRPDWVNKTHFTAGFISWQCLLFQTPSPMLVKWYSACLPSMRPWVQPPTPQYCKKKKKRKRTIVNCQVPVCPFWLSRILSKLCQFFSLDVLCLYRVSYPVLQFSLYFSVILSR